jgi:hypothetical protein
MKSEQVSKQHSLSREQTGLGIRDRPGHRKEENEGGPLTS